MSRSYERDPHDDPIAPARGIVTAVLLSMLGWMPLFVLAYLGWRFS